MSLEDAVHRLANAVGMHEDVAVREIIRERDEARGRLASMTNDRDGWKRWHDDEQVEKLKLQRKVSSLRGVITRIKRKAEQTIQAGK